MSTPRIVTAMRELVSRLQAISQAEGYHTDLGARVFDGWPMRLIAGEQVSFPLVAVYPGTDAPQNEQGESIKAERTVAVHVFVNQHETEREWFDFALFDIRQAVMGMRHALQGVTGVRTAETEFGEMEDGAIVRAHIPVVIDYTDCYGG